MAEARIVLEGKNALVTGGNRGIGLEIARSLANAGAKVWVTTRTRSNDCEFEPLLCDFENNEQVIDLAKKIRKLRVDILVNNAGINKIAKFEEIELADWDRIHQINLRAPFQLCQAVLPSMLQNNWGRIVNIASIFGKVSKECRASYSSSKFGLDGLTAALAAEVASRNILANTVSPGFVDTELTRTVLSSEDIANLTALVPMKRLCLPSEIGQAVLWLSSPLNTFISGQNIIVDGGFTRV